MTRLTLCTDPKSTAFRGSTVYQTKYLWFTQWNKSKVAEKVSISTNCTLYRGGVGGITSRNQFLRQIPGHAMCFDCLWNSILSFRLFVEHSIVQYSTVLYIGAHIFTHQP